LAEASFDVVFVLILRLVVARLGFSGVIVLAVVAEQFDRSHIALMPYPLLTMHVSYGLNSGRKHFLK
jgi:hypothetical protein